jgi:predicted  nucleic acid-binding Zn-ribbon protein
MTCKELAISLFEETARERDRLHKRALAAEAQVRDLDARRHTLAKCLLDATHRVDELMARVRALESALRRAREDMEGWAEYASEYFREKHDLAGDLDAIDAALDMGGTDDRA